VGGAGQHAVFGSDPAFARAFFVARHFLFHRRGAQHFGVAKLNQHRAFGMHGVVTGNAHGAQLVGSTGVARGGQGGGHEFVKERSESDELSVNLT